MRGIYFWIGQFVLACATMNALLVAVGLLRGEVFAEHWIENLAWAGAAAAIFVGSRYVQARKGAQCAACEETAKTVKK
jgi:hypothetical protein